MQKSKALLSLKDPTYHLILRPLTKFDQIYSNGQSNIRLGIWTANIEGSYMNEWPQNQIKVK